MKTRQSEKGFTLIEVLVAMVVLTIGILSLYTMQVSSIRGNSHASRLTEASTWNADNFEQIIGMQYFAKNEHGFKPSDPRPPMFPDKDGNGTGQDTNQDGIDDNGGNFGLNDTTGNQPADHSSTTEDGKYTIFWNIAEDVPMRDLKTIRVLVRDNRNVLSAPVVFTYIKADPFD